MPIVLSGWQGELSGTLYSHLIQSGVKPAKHRSSGKDLGSSEKDLKSGVITPFVEQVSSRLAIRLDFPFCIPSRPVPGFMKSMCPCRWAGM